MAHITVDRGIYHAKYYSHGCLPEFGKFGKLVCRKKHYRGERKRGKFYHKPGKVKPKLILKRQQACGVKVFSVNFNVKAFTISGTALPKFHFLSVFIYFVRIFM